MSLCLVLRVALFGVVLFVALYGLLGAIPLGSVPVFVLF